MTLEIKNGDCLKYMAELPDKSVDLFVCDLPYMETNCAWDQKGVDLEEFWKQFKRLRKSKKTLCIHFCSTKFGYSLIKSNEKMFKMDMVWKKRNKTGGLQSRYRPMRNHEMVYFFYEQAPKYNRDRYHKRIVAKQKVVKKDGAVFGHALEGDPMNLGINCKFDPKLPASVLSDMDKTTNEYKEGECHAEAGSKYKPEHRTRNNYKPRQPGSYLEETVYGIDKKIATTSGADIANMQRFFEPPNPASVVEEKNAESNKLWGYDKPDTFKINKDGTNQNFDPKLPASVVEEPKRKSIKDRKGIDMTNVYTKENNKEWLKTNKGFDPKQPTSVVETINEDTYEDGERTHSNKAWKGNIRKMKDLEGGFKPGPMWDPKLPASVMEGDAKWIKEAGKNGHGYDKHKPEYGNSFNPVQPASVLEGDAKYTQEHLDNNRKGAGTNDIGAIFNRENNRAYLKINKGFTPTQPASVLEERLTKLEEVVFKDDRVNEKGKSAHGWDINHMDAPRVAHFDPKLPVSVLEDESLDLFDFIEDAENAPYSVYASKKCFIGKRNHQTEKPLDILEFFLKYWSDEGDTILDPTMGSGSTGVACAKLGRNFIGYEMDEKIFKVAENRIKNKK